MIFVLIPIILFAFFIYFVRFHNNRLFLAYPLIAYLLVWPRFLDEIGIVPLKGAFGSIQIGDVFLLCFAFVFLMRFFSRNVQSVLFSYRVPLTLVALFVSYWFLQVLIQYLTGGSRIYTLNQLRSLVYYAFLLFFLVRMRDAKDVADTLRFACLLTILIFVIQLIFFALYTNPSLKAFLLRKAPDFYDEVYVQKRFEITNFKTLFILAPFVLNLFFLPLHEIRLKNMYRIVIFSCAFFLFIVGQSRAMWILLAFSMVLSAFLFVKKRRFVYTRIARVIPMAIAGLVVILFAILAANVFVPDLIEKLQARTGSLTVESIGTYETGKEMKSLRSRIQSYDLLLARLGDDFFFGKGLGNPVDLHSAFKVGVDSTYLMILWAGGLIPLILFLVLELYVLLKAIKGYVGATSGFEVYFFASSIASLGITYILAIQDRILYFGNGVIMFVYLSAMVLVAEKGILSKRKSAEGSLRSSTMGTWK